MTSRSVQKWHDQGIRLDVPDSPGTRIWRQGEGAAVVCLHGVPSSAYLYRKVLPELADRGLEGIALDIQGLGFSDRPADFDYTWTGLSGWLEKALDAAGLREFHLVVHDVGGPIGFDLVRRVPHRVSSLTVLNTITKVSTFRKPRTMRTFEKPVLGRMLVMQMNSPLVVPFFRWKGVNAGPSYAEIRAYGELLAQGDGGSAFLRMMRNFETTAEFEMRVLASLRNRSFPAQVIWGRDDPELRVESFGEDARNVLGLERDIHLVDGKHFLQENSPVEIARRIALLVETGDDI